MMCCLVIALLCAGLMLLAGCMNGDHARRSIQWDVNLCIAAAFGVSNALQNTRVAYVFAQVFISDGEGTDTVACWASVRHRVKILCTTC
jgi:di/tricarboxylate transporter